MTKLFDPQFCKHLNCSQDLRRHNTRHLLHDMLLIALCAIISGADAWTQVAENMVDPIRQNLEPYLFMRSLDSAHGPN
ncbi:MAG: transposase family protein [Desulfobacteraceae bacterium]|nr:transposase family protein [Desulfobacteraceae bacterium]